MNGCLNKKRAKYEEGKPFFPIGPFIILFFLIPLFLTDYVSAKIWYVHHADPNKEIQKMINMAAFGDTVLVPKGVYHVECKIDPIKGTNIAGIELKEGVELAGAKEDLGEVVITSYPNCRIIRAKSHTCIRNLVICDSFIGIECDKSAADIAIEHNLIINNTFGINNLADNVNISNNTIAHNYKRGVIVKIPDLPADPNRPILSVQGNIIAFNGLGLEFTQIIDWNSPQVHSSDLTNVFFSYNDFYDRVVRYWIDKNYNIIAENEIMISRYGPGNFSANPYFVCTDKEDYHLLSYSPCIDMGDPQRNYAHEPPPNGQRINLGFYGNTPQAAAGIDTDNDGLYDHQEGVEDFDNDDVPDWQDADTATIKSPWWMQKISFHLQHMGRNANQNIYFKDAQVVLPSALDVDPPEGIFPFEAIQFKVPDLDGGASISIIMHLPKNFGALGASRYLAMSFEKSWQSLPFKINPNKKAITFIIEDGRAGDRDGIRNGDIKHLGGLVTPQSITLEDPKSCFIQQTNPFILDQAGFSPLEDYPAKERGEPTYPKGPAFWCLSILFQAGLLIYCLAKGKIKRNGRLLVFLIVILPLFLFSYGWAQQMNDIPIEIIEITSSPNPVGSGARALGMGGAFIGVADDATAASWNPAGLMHLVSPEISWVEVHSSRSDRYRFENSYEESGEYRLSAWDVNYLSMAFPGRLFKRNFAISLNYQHLYDFSKKLPSYCWQSFLEDPYYMDIDYQASYEQSGAIKALSPALAVTVTPRLSLGLTVNIYSDKLFTNEWVRKYHQDGQGVVAPNQSIIIHFDCLEKYTFSGLNYNLGLLWDIGEIFTLGLVYKTPFTAHLEHTIAEYKIQEYPQKSFPTKYNYYSPPKDQEQLSMPRSFGIGLAYNPIDPLVIDLDIYRTDWGDYELIQADGQAINPITGFNKAEVTVKPTYQIRLGAEYAFVTKKGPIPTIRGGAFYDPAPAPNQPDDYYGVSLGLGMTLREKKRTSFRRKKKKRRKDIMSIDMAYQYRWGRKVGRHTIKGEDSPTNVAHHLVYISLIYYIHTGTY